MPPVRPGPPGKLETLGPGGLMVSLVPMASQDQQELQDQRVSKDHREELVCRVFRVLKVTQGPPGVWGLAVR